MNHIRRIGTDGVLESSAPNTCHPAQSKHAYHHDAASGRERNFRIAIRFLDHHDTKGVPVLFPNHARQDSSALPAERRFLASKTR